MSVSRKTFEVLMSQNTLTKNINNVTCRTEFSFRKPYHARMEDDFPKPPANFQKIIEDARRLCKEAGELRKRAARSIEEHRAVSEQVFEDIRESKKKIRKAKQVLE